MPRALIVGCGFLGAKAALFLRKMGWSVAGITRSAESAPTFEDGSVRMIACDVSDAAQVSTQLGDLGEMEAVLYCVSSGRGGVEGYRKAYLEGLENLLAVLRTQRLVFTSSTSVYAQTDGQWVTETSAADPERETGKILRQAEEIALRRGGIVARLAGLYGPGRSVLLRKFLDGTARVEGDGTRWINQIHRDDAASALVHLATADLPGGIYNVSDDEPMRQRDLYAFLAGQFQRPLPPPGPVDLDRKRGWTSKRVSNARLRAAGWSCAYPSFRDAVGELLGG